VELLTTEILTIRPANLQDKEKIFTWLTHSNLTSEMLGPPNFPDIPIPTWDEFDNDYLDFYFDGSQPLKGQCFILIHHEEEIGQINYNEIDTSSKSTEIDIWLADRKFTGKGLGTIAIKTLCNYLDKYLDCKTIYIAPSRRNSNAIKSYKKAGFVETEIRPDNFIADYEDTVLMIRTQHVDAEEGKNSGTQQPFDYLESVKKQFEYYKMLGEKTFAQLSDEQLFEQFNEESNSIATIVKHLWGNMLSRWTDFLTTDGEKEWRQREAEFDNDLTDRNELVAKWNEGWACLFNALGLLTENDLTREIFIRNQGHSVVEAINRQLAHYPYHIGQIVFIGKLLLNDKWHSLSIPRGNSKAYNADKFSKPKQKQHFTDEYLNDKV